jgi:simple sugar transport system substrate-binding protein
MYKNLAATLVAAFSLLAATATQAAPPQQTPVKAAWIYMSPITEAGWTRQHETARQQVQQQLGRSVQTTHVANVPEGPDAERVLRDLAVQGNQIIFTTSFGYMEPAMKVARDFPNVKFEVLTGYKRAPNVATANARYYEGRYLAGIAAGRMSKSQMVGYVAGFPIPEVLQGINAFALGVRSVNPQATVRVIWLNEWFNPARERDAAMLLMDQGADVLAFHTASTAVATAAQERGKYVVAYHSDMRKFAPTAQIVAVTHHWGDYETGRIRALQAGQWRSQNVWQGVKQGAVRVDEFGPAVPAAVKKEVLARQADIAAARLHPFTGPLQSQDGKFRLAAGKTLSDEQILGMDWLLQGVQAAPFSR